MKKSVLLFAASIVLVVLANVCYAADTVIMPVIEKEKNIQDGLIVRGPKVVWKTKTDKTISSGFSAPISIHEGIIYIALKGSKDDQKGGYLCAVDAATGTNKWMQPIGGVNQMPLVDDSLIYFGAYDGFLYCVSKDSGEVKWKFKTQNWEKYGMQIAPIPGNDTIYFGYDDGFFYALDKKTGKLKWKTDIEGSILDSPLFIDGKVYVGSSAGKVFAMDSQTGSVVWVHELKPDIFISNMSFDMGNLAFTWCDYPKDQKVKRTEVNYCLINSKTGELVKQSLWETSDAMSTPFHSANNWYFTVGNKVVAVGIYVGTKIWTFETKNIFYPNITIHDEIIYAAHRAFYGMDPKRPENALLYAIDRASGKMIWSYPVNAGINSPMLVTNGLVCGSAVSIGKKGLRSNYVYFLDAKTGKEKGKVIVADDEEIVFNVQKNQNQFYITSQDREGNSYIYSLTLDV